MNERETQAAYARARREYDADDIMADAAEG